VLKEVKHVGLEKLVPGKGRLGALSRQHWSEKREAGLNDMIKSGHQPPHLLL
jgi:hypothetical protein